MRTLAATLVVVSLLGGAARPTIAASDTTRCTNGLIEKGDPAIAVRHACGQPDFVDPWVGGASLAFGVAPSMEEWTYNRGPHRLLRILVFRNGRLMRIRDGDYGFRLDSGPTRCRPNDIDRGMSKYRLLHDCGPPAQRSGQFVYSSVRRSAGRTFYGQRGLVPVFRERWIYNFGSSRLLREVTLENAVVVATDTLQRGFDD